MLCPPAKYPLLCVLTLLALSCATSPVPDRRSVSDLNTDQLKAMLDRGTTLVLIDTRTEYEFRKGRIPGAVNIPPHQFDILAKLLPSDKNTYLVFYCRGST